MTTLRGLDYARRLYEEYGRELIATELADLEPVIATGLVGEGSECFGFDDDISQDHDWGPAFCLWLPEALLAEHGERIERALSRLPAQLDGHAVRMAPEERIGRVGPLSIEGFYRRFLNVPGCPETLAQWRAIPETYLAVATNGEVFCDPAGTFSAIRAGLLEFYPEDLRIKKLAARCVAASQAGQYNLPRMLTRYAYTSVSICRARFTEAIISMVFLLHKKYMPFYKWADKAMARLSPLGAGIAASLEQLNCLSPVENTSEQFSDIVEDICLRMVDCLIEQGLATVRDPWLYEQGPQVQAHIANEALRRMPVQFE